MRCLWPLVALGFLLGCTAPTTTARPTPSAPPPTIASSPSVLRPTTTPLPTATAAPAHPTVPPKSRLEPLPTDVPLPQSGALPELHAVADPTVLQKVLRVFHRGAEAVWVAQFPEDFPADLPLPSQGWLGAAVHLFQGDLTEVWTLFIEAAVPPAEWLQAWEARLQTAGWTLSGGGPMAGGGFRPVDVQTKAWCPPPSQDWAVDVLLFTSTEDYTVARLSFVRGPGAHMGLCGDERMLMPDVLLPVLTPPPGVRMDSAAHTWGGSTSAATQTGLESPDGLEPVVTAFRAQLAQQGWDIQGTSSGPLFDGEGVHLWGVRKDPVRGLLRLDVLIWGNRPRYQAYMRVGALPRVKRPPIPTADEWPRLLGQTENAAALKRALILSLGERSVFSGRMALWVGRMPEPWPLPHLPQPQERLLLAQFEAELPGTHSGNMWRFVLEPQDPARALEMWHNALPQYGWQPMPRERRDQEWMPGLVFEGRIPVSESLVFCAQGEAGPLSLVLWAEGDLLFLEHLERVGPCAVTSPPPMMGGMAGWPPLRLTFPDPQAWPYAGGGGSADVDAVVQTTLVYTTMPTDTILEGLLGQLRDQGWQVTGQGNLEDNLYWGVAESEGEGGSWRVRLLLFPVQESWLLVHFRLERSGP